MEADFKEEIYTGKSPDPITIEGTEKILNQMKNCICKISKEKGEKGTGFFCKIPVPGNILLPVLITNNHVLKEEDIKNNKIIKTTINDDKSYINITIDESRKKFTSKNLDITIIEIKPNKDNVSDFLSVDLDINKDKNILDQLYKSSSIYVLHYPKGNKVKVSYGLSYGVNDNEINHLCNTEEGSSGSPILSLNSFNVIGIHKGAPRIQIQKNKNKYNIGTLMKYAVEEFIQNVYNNNKNKINENKKLNEMSIIYRIGDFDTDIKLFGEEFVKNNKKKCVLIIDGKEHEICEIMDRDDLTCIKKNILKIKLKEIETITDMSYMFSKCDTLIDLPDISEWDTSNVNNMKYMFYCCEGLSRLSNISKWDISNVTNTSHMFDSCISLSTLPNISNWKTTSLSDMNEMFLNCKESLNVPSKFQ